MRVDGVTGEQGREDDRTISTCNVEGCLALQSCGCAKLIHSCSTPPSASNDGIHNTSMTQQAAHTQRGAAKLSWRHARVCECIVAVLCCNAVC